MAAEGELSAFRAHYTSTNSRLISQNPQERVQVSPISMKVAVPPLQHSVLLGHDASSQTVAILERFTVLLTKLNDFANVLPLYFTQSGAGGSDTIWLK